MDHSGPNPWEKPALWQCVPVLRVVVLVVLLVFAACLFVVGYTVPLVVSAVLAVAGAAATVARRIVPSPARP